MTTMDAAAVLVTTATAMLALGGVTFACARLVADPLDRIASIALLLIGVLGGVFALGDVALWMPAPLLDLLLLGNPIVGVASAARLDIFHGALLYDISPIAHRDVHYPAWQAAAALYGCTAIAAFLVARASRRGVRRTSTH